MIKKIFDEKKSSFLWSDSFHTITVRSLLSSRYHSATRAICRVPRHIR